MINDLFSRATKGQPEPVVGMGATVLLFSDRHAATVVTVFKIGKSQALAVQEDTARVVSGSGHDGSAVYEFEPNPAGRVHNFRFDGTRWREVRFNSETCRWNYASDWTCLRIDERSEYRDPSF